MPKATRANDGTTPKKRSRKSTPEVGNGAQPENGNGTQVAQPVNDVARIRSWISWPRRLSRRRSALAHMSCTCNAEVWAVLPSRTGYKRRKRFAVGSIPLKSLNSR